MPQRRRPRADATEYAPTTYESAGIGFHHWLSVEQLGEAYPLANQLENTAPAPTAP